jgi:fibronectin-binding autotransporter adhesin
MGISERRERSFTGTFEIPPSREQPQSTSANLIAPDLLRSELMKTSAPKVFAALIRTLIVATVIAFPIAARAASGTWTDVNPNDWSNANTASWLGGIIADGSGNTADFSTINLPADIAINVVDPRTIGNMTFGDTEIATTPASWLLSGANITLAGGAPTITVGTLGDTKTVSIANVLAGTAGLTKAGAGTLVLTGSNTFTGGVNITGGTLNTSSASTTLAKQIVTLSNGATWNFIAGTTPATSGWGLTNSGTAQPPAYLATAGAIFIPAGQSGTLAPTGNVNVGQVGGGAGSTLNVIVPNSGTFQALGSWATNAPGAINSGGSLGTLNVSVPVAGNTGRFVLNANTSNVVNNNDRFGVNSLQSTAFVINDGVTVFTRGPGAGNTVTLGSLAGTSGAIFAGGGGSGGATTTYSIGSLNTNTEYAGTITSENITGFGNTAGGTNITKVGTGTLTLSGPLLYSPNITRPIPSQRGGVTNITAGILALKNAATFASGTDQALNPNSIVVGATGTLDVSQSTNSYVSATTGLTVTGYSSQQFQQTLGTGTIAGNYNHAAGVLAPGNTLNAPGAGTATTPISSNPIAGTLNFTNNLSFSGAGTIAFDLTSPTSGTDLLQVGGGDVGGTPTLALNFLAAPSPGVYTIINANNALTGSLAGWTVGFSGRGTAPTLSFSGNQKQVLLTIGASSFGNVNWQGATDGITWDTQTTANWHNTAAGATNPDKFFASDTVNFLDTYDGVNAPQTTNISLNATVVPLSVNVNSTIDYSIAGSGAISGTSVSLTKSGTGTLSLQTANTYGGGTTVNGGTINLGSTGTLGTGTVTMNNGTVTAQTAATTNTFPAINLSAGSNNTLNLNGGTTHTIGAISGSGNLTLASDTATKTIDTNGSNPATGNVTVNGPVVRVGGTGGGAASGTTIHWILTGTGTIASGSSATQALGSVEGDAGTLKGFSGGSTAAAKTWDVGSLDSVGVERVFAGQIVDGTGSSGSTAATNITKSGAGTWTLAGNNTFRGTTVINAGVLKLKSTNALQNSALTPGGAGVVFDSSVDPHAFNIGGLNGSVDLPLVDNGGNPIALSIGGVTQNPSSTYNGVLSGNGASLTKTGTGTFTLGGNNTYTGTTTISTGTLRLGAADRIANSSDMTIANGTFATQGFSETVATLTVSGTGTLDLGNGASQVHFADSHLQLWGGLLTVKNYTLADAVFFGSTSSGLDPSQLSQIAFSGFGSGATISNTGQISPAGPAVTTLGDFNRDGLVTAADIPAMLRALTDLGFYQTNNFLTAQDVKNIADVNFDGVVNNSDIQPELDYLASLGLGSVAPVPEPASFALLALGGALLFGVRRNRA